jgi:hypothetical protein
LHTNRTVPLIVGIQPPNAPLPNPKAKNHAKHRMEYLYYFSLPLKKYTKEKFVKLLTHQDSKVKINPQGRINRLSNSVLDFYSFLWFAKRP